MFVEIHRKDFDDLTEGESRFVGPITFYDFANEILKIVIASHS